MSDKPLHTVFDKAAFESVFRSHFQYLCNYAKQYVREEETARDITQKVFITLWEKRLEIDPQMSVKSWLFTSVRNRCLNYIRDHKKYQSEVLDLDCGDFDLSVEDHHFVEEELGAKIQVALATLPEKCRQVFEMSRFDEKKYKEIAVELDISPKTVEAHMSKAIKTLREYLRDYLVILILLMEYG